MKRLITTLFSFLLPLALMGQEDGLHDIEDVIYLPYWTTPRLLALGVGALVLLAILVFLILKWRKKAAPRVTPYERATAYLKDQLVHVNDGEDKQFCAQVSNVVRNYLEEELAIPAPERTTEEFLLEIEAHPLIQGEVREALGEFLKQCDLVKFAKESFGQENRTQLIDNASSLVTKTYEAKRTIELQKEKEAAA